MSAGSGSWFTEAEVVRAFHDVLRRRHDGQWDERRDPQINRLAGPEQPEPAGFTALYKRTKFTFTLDGEFVGSARIVQDDHNKAPYVARALTRYVTGGAILTAFRWLQRKAGVRRAVESGTRPSDTTQGGEFVEFIRDEQYAVTYARDGAGGIYLDARGVDGSAHLRRDELFELTELLADLIDCDLRIRDNDGPI